MDFTGKTAIVTGAASGMGRATAVGFGKLGANVALFDVNEAGAQAVADTIDASGDRAVVHRVDISNPSETQAAIRAVHERFGRLDALANVAAIYKPSRIPVLEVTEEQWDRHLDLNLRGLFFACQEALRIMWEQGSGAIVNVASGAAFRPLEGRSPYAASKAGVVGMSRVLALESARRGVRVNVTAPGYTEGEASPPPEQTAAVLETLVPGRFMTNEEQADTIIWLCSEEASGVNGTIVFVNGGHHMPSG
jgi:NAD(P)-dependent dehydrogenase (short-subunit alcohol dehydrogenase family)